MKILYIGDVMGEMGLATVEAIVPQLRLQQQIDLVIAQAENVSDGRGITVLDFQRLQAAGVDFCTGGNWSLHRPEIYPLLSDPTAPIIRPANYPLGTPGLGAKYITVNGERCLIISLLGHVVGKDADKPFDNPLRIIDEILENEKDTVRAATIVNLHGDYSSEKVVIGHYLDGRVSLVVGDHWHVPTADARVLPKGTAHVTDVGMVGSLDSSLGVSFDSVIPRWRDGKQTRNVLANSGRKQFNGVLVETNPKGSAMRIEQIIQLIN